MHTEKNKLEEVMLSKQLNTLPMMRDSVFIIINGNRFAFIHIKIFFSCNLVNIYNYSYNSV